MRNKNGTISPDVASANSWNSHLKPNTATALTFKTKTELYEWMDMHPLWTDANKDQLYTIWRTLKL